MVSGASRSSAVKAFLHLVVQYCNDRRPKRQAEFDECVRRNLDNPHVECLHNLVEPDTVVPDWFRTHPKYRDEHVADWLTYRAALDYANANLEGKTVCVANLDIFLDGAGTDWRAARRLNSEGVVLCLSRHEFDGEGGSYKDPALARLAFANTQDAWVFQAPLAVGDCDFEVGMLGCDNAFAERLKRGGYIPLNAPDRFKIYHYDQARGKTGKNFLGVHQNERGARPANRHPEDAGHYLVPDIDAVRSVDNLLKSLRVSKLETYTLICEVMTRFTRLRNR